MSLKKQRKVKLVNALTEEEIKEISKKDDFTNLVARLLFNTGMRVGELCDLKWEDINIEESIINIKHGKGDKQRYIPITDEAKVVFRLIKELLESEVYVLETRTGDKYLRQYVWYHLKKLGDKIHPHLFRHTFATTLLRKGIDIKRVSTLLGHADTKITMDIYLHPTIDDLKTALKDLNK